MFAGRHTARARDAHRKSAWWEISALTLSLAGGACLFASGMASPVHARISWLGLLPLLIMVRLSRPCWAAAGGAFWGLLVWLFGAALLSDDVPMTAAAVARLAGVGGGFGLLGAAATQRFGFHPFLLSAAWLVVELVVQPPDRCSGRAVVLDGSSGFVVRTLGAAYLGALVVLGNALLLWLAWAVVGFPGVRLRRPGGGPPLARCAVPNSLALTTRRIVRAYPRAPPCGGNLSTS